MAQQHRKFTFDGAFEESTFVRDLDGLCTPWTAAQAPSPRLLALNEELATELGFDPDALRTPEQVAVLVGNRVASGSTPVAQVYAGHQFGGWSPRLGDGRALLVGELLDVHGGRRDLHLKGSGRTPFARGGDGKAVVGPMLRELIVGEAMHALGIPTTRALAVVATGELVARETMLPGAVLARVAASHLRVGTFQYAASTGDSALQRRLLGHAIRRHHPSAADEPNPALALLDRVLEAQAGLVARWMQVGFVHGVMNTDNMTISGETIDYGPCAFLDGYHPDTVFSSIDHHGRYAFGNQPRIALWNLARLAEALLPMIDDDTDRAAAAATDVLQRFPEVYAARLLDGMRTKLGLTSSRPDDGPLVDDLLQRMSVERLDFTGTFRALADHLRGGDAPDLGDWLGRWLARLDDAATTTAERMDRANPVYVPRNHLVEEALAAATEGDLSPLARLLAVLASPYERRAGLERYEQPAPAGGTPYRTFCGT